MAVPKKQQTNISDTTIYDKELRSMDVIKLMYVPAAVVVLAGMMMTLPGADGFSVVVVDQPGWPSRLAATRPSTTTTARCGLLLAGRWQREQRNRSCSRSAACGGPMMSSSSRDGVPGMHLRRRSSGHLRMARDGTGDGEDGGGPPATTTTTTTTTMLRTRTTTSDRTEDASRRTSAAIRDLMAEHDPILLFASNLLTPSKAADASALYAWCRRLDEICDDESDNATGNYRSVRARLGVWQDRFDALWTTSTTNKDDDVDD